MSEMENTTIPFPELHQLMYPALMGLAFNELDNVMIPSHMLFSLTIVFFLRVRSWTLCAQWTCHVLRTHLPCTPASRITCHRLVYSYVPVPVLRVPFYYMPSSFELSTRLGYSFVLRFPFCLVNSSMLTITAYAFPL